MRCLSEHRRSRRRQRCNYRLLTRHDKGVKLRSVFCSFDFGLKIVNKVRIIVLGPTESLRINDFFGLTKFGLTMKFYIKQRRTKIGTRKILRNNGDFGLSVFEITVLKCIEILFQSSAIGGIVFLTNTTLFYWLF